MTCSQLRFLQGTFCAISDMSFTFRAMADNTTGFSVVADFNASNTCHTIGFPHKDAGPLAAQISCVCPVRRQEEQL
jgi:hypothetical protein